MIEITYKKAINTIEFESSGHAYHDICVFTSAICSTLVQYLMQKAAEKKIIIEKQIYHNGHTYAKFKIMKNYKEIISGIEALLIGFEMISKNYPDEINFIIIQND